jgi:hypothetical protein
MHDDDETGNGRPGGAMDGDMRNDDGGTGCERLREILPEHAEGLLGPGDADFARDHLAACADCRAVKDELARGFAAMDLWREEPLPAGAFERLQARLASRAVPPQEIFAPSFGAATPTAQAARGWGRVVFAYAAGLATAACALLAYDFGTGVAPVAPSRGPIGASGDAVPSRTGDAAPRPAEAAAAPASTGESLSGYRAVGFDVDDRGQGLRRKFTVPANVRLRGGEVLEIAPVHFAEPVVGDGVR